MNADVAVQVDEVSKKYCKSVKRSTLYGAVDVLRNAVGLRSDSATLRKDEFWAVESASFELRQAQTLGIIGPNGSGKTTLLKMLNGIFWPDKGKILIQGRVGSLIEIGAGFHPLLTGRENIYINAAILGMTRQEVESKIGSIVEFAGIGDFLDMPVKNYSSGMFVRLGFSVAIHCIPDVMLIDEVLAVGDMDFQIKCFNELGKLKMQGVTTILVSHNMMHMLGFCDTVLYINKGRIEYCGAADKAIAMYQEDMAPKNSFSPSVKCERDNFRGSGKISLIRLEFLNADGQLIDSINAGGNFILRVHYSAARNIGSVELDIALGGQESGILFHASSKSYRREIYIQQGSGYIDVHFDNICINNQMLLFYVAMWKYDRSELFAWIREVPFYVSGDVRCGGKILLNIDWANYQGVSL